MSKQVTLFLETCSPEDRQSLLDLVEKIASGEVVGKPLNLADIPEEARKVVEADERAPRKRNPRN